MHRHNFGRFSAPVNSDKLRIANHPGLTTMELAAPPEHCVPSRHVSHIQSFGAASMLPPGCSGGFSIAGGIPLVWNSVVLTQHTMVADEGEQWEGNKRMNSGSMNKDTNGNNICTVRTCSRTLQKMYLVLRTLHTNRQCSKRGSTRSCCGQEYI